MSASAASSANNSSSIAVSSDTTASSNLSMSIAFTESNEEAHEDAMAGLPSYEEATQTTDVARLPSYRKSRPLRYHPYRHDIPALVDGTGVDRLFNTIYDEEYIRIIVPPAPARRLPTQPLVATELQDYINETNAGNAYHRVHPPHPDAEEFDRRAQNIAAVILQEFVAGLLRAQEA